MKKPKAKLLLPLFFLSALLISCNSQNVSSETNKADTNKLVNEGLSGNYADAEEQELIEYLLVNETHLSESGDVRYSIIYQYNNENLIRKAHHDSRGFIEYNIVEYELDADGNIIEAVERTSASQIKERYSCTYKNGVIASKTEYDERGYVLKTSDYNESGLICIETGYSDYGERTNWYKKYYYDSNLNLILIEEYNRDDEIIRIHSYSYDEKNNVILDLEENTHTPIKKMTEYEYDSHGNVKKAIEKETSLSGSEHTEIYDLVYDENNNLISMTNSNWKGDVIESIKVNYSSDGNILEYKEFGRDQEYTGGYRCEYDSKGHLIKQTYYGTDGAEIAEAEYAYDEQGNVIKDILTRNGLKEHWYEYEYDQHGNKTDYVERDSEGNQKDVVKYTYVPCNQYEKDKRYFTIEIKQSDSRIISELTDGYWITNGRRVAYQTIYRFYDDGTYESLIYGQIDEGTYTCERGVLSLDSTVKYPYYYDEINNKWISEGMVLAGGDTYNDAGFYVPLYEVPATLQKIDDISAYYFGGDVPVWKGSDYSKDDMEQAKKAIYFYESQHIGWNIYSDYGYGDVSFNESDTVYEILGNPSLDDIKSSFRKAASLYLDTTLIEDSFNEMNYYVVTIDGRRYLREEFVGTPEISEDSFSYFKKGEDYIVTYNYWQPNTSPDVAAHFVRQNGKLLLSRIEYLG